jgi:EmrB/QacA subfamily drug resistance transporter
LGAVWVLALTSVASLMVALDAMVVSTALPTIRRDLHASIASLEWTVSAYVLSFGVLLMTGAALGDRFGRRRLFCAGLGLFSAASVGCALAPSIGWLIAARAVQGAGAAVMMPLALALLSGAFAPEERANALGIFGAVTGLGGVLGPLVGGAAVQGISWQWIFWINVPIGLITLAVARQRIAESFGPSTATDMTGLTLVTGGAFGIVWALVRGNAAGWSSAEVLAPMAIGVMLVLAFIRWEVRASAPMLPMGLFRSRSFCSGNAAIFSLWGSALGALFFMAQFLQIALHYGPLAAGLGLVPWGATMLFVGPLAGARIRRFGERPFIACGLTLVAAGASWLAIVAKPDLAYWHVLAPLEVMGIGFSMAIPATQSAVMTHVAPEQLGKASGTFTTLRQFGGAFGVAAAVAAFTASGSYASAHSFTDGFGPALAVCAALALTGAIAGLLAPARHGARTPTNAGQAIPADAPATARGDPTLPPPCRPAGSKPGHGLHGQPAALEATPLRPGRARVKGDRVPTS